ncbi:hypothetical protein HOY82DRAFT_592270 [Tuber indicum]|nr:hypothetical protein HOY82DRAFT_592270 [Tuber indicum]
MSALQPTEVLKKNIWAEYGGAIAICIAGFASLILGLIFECLLNPRQASADQTHEQCEKREAALRSECQKLRAKVQLGKYNEGRLEVLETVREEDRKRQQVLERELRAARSK